MCHETERIFPTARIFVFTYPQMTDKDNLQNFITEDNWGEFTKTNREIDCGGQNNDDFGYLQNLWEN